MDKSEMEHKNNEKGIILNFLKRTDGAIKGMKPPFSSVVKEVRENLLLSRAELARRAGVSPLTINRIENGSSCRIDTKRKIVLALGRNSSDMNMIFQDD